MSALPRGIVPPTLEEIRRLVGPVTDDRLAAIAATGASRAEIELAAAYAQGLGDVPGRGGHPLEGRAADVFDILRADDEELEPDR
jgi:hypothetical protein